MWVYTVVLLFHKGPLKNLQPFRVKMVLRYQVKEMRINRILSGCGFGTKTLGFSSDPRHLKFLFPAAKCFHCCSSDPKLLGSPFALRLHSPALKINFIFISKRWIEGWVLQTHYALQKRKRTRLVKNVMHYIQLDSNELEKYIGSGICNCLASAPNIWKCLESGSRALSSSHFWH